MKFTKTEFDKFRKDVDQALLPLAEKYALSITAGDIRYANDTFSVKVKCARTDAGNLELKEFEKCCSLFGFSPDDYMREFTFENEKHALVGFSTGSSKYPCICLNLCNNKRYKLTEDAVKKQMGLKAG